jgi:hypothetical protein
MEALTGHWDSRDNRDTLIVLCPEMSQHDPSYYGVGQLWTNVPECPGLVPCPSMNLALIEPRLYLGKPRIYQTVACWEFEKREYEQTAKLPTFFSNGRALASKVSFCWHVAAALIAGSGFKNRSAPLQCIRITILICA